MSRVVYSQYRGTAPVYSGYAPPEPMIYCPVCRVEYPQSQTNDHILIHTIQNVRFAEKKQQEAISTQHSKNTFVYPMVEPLEFSTSQMKQVTRRNILNFSRHEKNKKPPKVIQMVDKETQTWNKPVLQYWKQETDLYNCFDSVFNGQGFRKDDVVKNNYLLASKRNLNQWENERLRK